MSIPSGIIKFRGNWSVTAAYLYADMVVSPINSFAYVLIVPTLTGGSDPSVTSANWVLDPSGSGVTAFAQYYRTSAQNMTSGSTDIIFTNSQPQSDTTFITWTGPSKNFTVSTKGLYQLEFNLAVATNGSTWTSLAKVATIDITRSPTAEQAVVASTVSIPSGTAYSLLVNASLILNVGDVINCRIADVFTGGPSTARGLENLFDLNTFFTWTLIKAL